MPNLHVLDGGLNGWISAGKPVRRGRERISLERQVRIAAGALAAAGGLLASRAHPRFGLLSAFVGGGLVFAGVTDTCGMARMLAKLPTTRQGATWRRWSRPSSRENPCAAGAKEELTRCFLRGLR